MYCAIIGDIVKSRQIQNRQEVQRKFKNVINDQVNELFANDIASKFVVTLGDEFQGLLFSPHRSYDIVDYIKREMEPISLVFGVAIGEMSTEFDADLAIGSDGPVYSHARDMVIRAKKKKPSVCYYFKNRSEMELVNALLYFIETSKGKRSIHQRKVVELYEELQSQYKVAQFLGLEQSTVSSTLHTAWYYQVKKAEDSIKDFLKVELNR